MNHVLIYRLRGMREAKPIATSRIWRMIRRGTMQATIDPQPPQAKHYSSQGESIMSTNCVRCIRNERTGSDLLCDDCREEAIQQLECNRCGRIETPPYTEGDSCYEGCGGVFHFNQAQNATKEG